MARESDGGKEIEDAALPRIDKDFEAAARARDFEAIVSSLKAGANPNRVFTDEWNEDDGFRAIWFLGEEFRGRHGGTPEEAEALSSGHAGAMRALVEAGADFSLPSLMARKGRGHPFLTKSASSFYDRGRNLWVSAGLSIESSFWFAKGGGDMAGVFGGGEHAAALHSRGKRMGSAEEVLGPMWEVAIQPMMEAAGGKLALLTKTLGSGLLEWSQWLVAKGAKPMMDPDGSGALRMLAKETIFFANPARAGHCSWEVDKEATRPLRASMEEQAARCAKLAVELGEDVSAAPGENGAPVLLALLAQQGKASVEVSLRFAKALVELGADSVAGHEENPLVAYALADPANALAQLDFALGMGADPKDRASRSVLVLLKRATAEHDKQAAAAIRKLAALGGDLSQGPGHARDESLVARAAERGLWESIKALGEAGCDLSWKDVQTGDTAMSLAAWWSVERGRSGCAEKLAGWLAKEGAPMDEPGVEAMTPLHRAAKALDAKLCEALLSAGADANKAMADKDAMTPAHLACSRFEKKKEKAQLATLEALARHGADFSKLDGKGRSVTEVASKKAFLSVVMSVAAKAQGVALEGESGVRAAKALGERGAGFLAMVEESELSAAARKAQDGAKKPRVRRSL